MWPRMTSIRRRCKEEAIRMQTKDFERAYDTLVNKQKPRFEGN